MKKPPLTEQDYLFDGFAHRPFNPSIDGWMNAQTSERTYPVVDMARQVLEMMGRIQELERENWRLKRDLERERGHSSELAAGTKRALGAALSAAMGVRDDKN